MENSCLTGWHRPGFPSSSIHASTWARPVVPIVLALLAFCFPGLSLGAPPEESAGPVHRILVVHSYHRTMPWVQDYTRGIRHCLLKHKDIKFTIRHFYMDTKRHPEFAEEKGREAHKVFETWKPDSVIACDDNAQKYFVVPYLKNKTSVPVIFLGVNAEPEEYGYPATNVTGVLERNHVVMSLRLLQRLRPGCRRIAVINDASPTGLILTERIRKALSVPSASDIEIIGYFNTNSFDEWKELIKGFQKKADGIYFITYFTFLDSQGRHVPVLEALKWLILNSRIPEATNTMDTVRNGALCSIAIDGFVSGEDAAELLVKVFHGARIPDVPLTKTERGLRLMNRSRAKMLKIEIPPYLISGTIFFDSPFINSMIHMGKK